MVDLLIVDDHVPRRQRDPVAFPPKLSIPPAANVSTPSPSPLTASLTEQYYDAEEYFLAPASPDEDGDVFYDWYEEPSEHKRVSAAVEQIPEPEYDGAAKGRIDRKQISRNMASAPSFSPASPFPPASPFSPTPLAPSSGFTFARGPAKTTVNLAPGHVAINPVAEEARKFVSQDSCFPRKPVKKALAVGINYMTWDKDKRLYYAVNDAKLWRDTFVGKGVEPENIKIVTDDGDMRDAPTFDTLLGHIRWLVRDATAGDSLFFVFSGHAILTQTYGPSILTADKRIFPRPILEKELVMSIPAGVDLQVVFDCCHSGGMIGLQYCVGRMLKPTPPSDSHTEPTTCPAEYEPELRGSTPPRQPSTFPHSPQHASLYGISAAGDAAPPPPVTPDMVDLDTFGSLPQRPPRGGVVAAPPLTTATAAGTQPGAAVGAVRYLGSLIGLGSSSVPTPAPAPAPPPTELSTATARSGPRRACQGVVEGVRMPDYFEERTEGFVAPAGKVASLMVWAGTGESQKAFESYGGARQGVVTKTVWASAGESQKAFESYGGARHGVLTKAMCAAFERINTRRDLWSYLVQEIETENNKRAKRDANRSIGERPLPSSRIQHAELWVSQAHLLPTQPSATPVLDQPIL
ncbi:unnamed protein product [Rhizoctonia solani]|uniref:Metacaspase-1 n=1 Tax=Rhizoctonia solani TaxID=456999 RepID=A0A8H3DG40_9AGAM|nr:unnamed protein product [Rhizoctonia solani]